MAKKADWSSSLPKCEANYGPLTPISFLQRAAAVCPEGESVIYGSRRFTWAETFRRCRQLASALQSHSVAPGETVAVVAPNVPAMYEVHFAIPMAGAVLNTINIRLDARTMAVILAHAEARVIFVDTELLPLVRDALALQSSTTSQPPPLLVRIDDPAAQLVEENQDIQGDRNLPNTIEYEDFLQKGDPNYSIRGPQDEWESISINYTSGTTAAPKGVVYHHRGAYLNALAAALDWDMHASNSKTITNSSDIHFDINNNNGDGNQKVVYLWAVPMFHCNGWCFPWTMAALTGTNVCLRTVNVKSIFDALVEHKVTHLGGAPIILSMIANAQDHERRPLSRKLELWTGGAPPPPAILSKLESLGFSVGHGYGLTETFGPAMSCAWKEEWSSLPGDQRARMKARQGVGHLGISNVEVMNPETMRSVPRDGATLGEVMIKGHTVMKGYLKDTQATENAFREGWFHTGDLGVMHPDGYLELKDRSKDIIISGGENISSIEVESVLFQHPQILEAAVVARPDSVWGETPCAFVTLREDPGGREEGSGPSSTEEILSEDIIRFCRGHLPHFMVPKTVVFGTLPKSATGKIQKNDLRHRAKALPGRSGSTADPSTTRSKL